MTGAAVAVLLALSASAEPPRLSLTMTQSESAALAHSPALRAAALEGAGAAARAEEQFSSLLPRLTLDGSYRYQSEVPNFSVAPGQPARPFGDHRATSIGPTVSWTLWDQGALYKTWRAQQARAASADEQKRLVGRRTLLGTRLAYIQAQLAGEQLREFAVSLGLAEAQYREINQRFRAGAVSRIDTLSSHQESLQRRKQFLQAQSELAASVRELLRLIGREGEYSLLRPLDARISSGTATGLADASVIVQFDALDVVFTSLSAASATVLDTAHPSVAAYARQAEAARLNASSLNAGRGPVVRFQGRASYDYPNGPVLESVTQKSVGLTASLPLFEGRRTARAVEEQRFIAGAAESRSQLAAEELRRDWDVAKVDLSALRAQAELDAQSVAETEELSRLVYLSYKGGRSNYLEVQTANLRALEAKVQSARTRARILIRLATLADLAVQG